MTTSLYVSSQGGSVEVRSNGPEVDNRLRAELGEYLQIDYSQPQDTTLLGTVVCSTNSIDEDLLRAAFPNGNGKSLLLHGGSAPGDFRVGLEGVTNTKRVILSFSTGTAFVVDKLQHTITVCNPDKEVASIDVRRIVRNHLLWPFIEQIGGAFVHASAIVTRRGEGILFPGSSGSGKTTFFLAALAKRRFQFLSCERIILLPSQGDMYLYASPESIRFFPGSLRAYPETVDHVSAIDKANDWDRRSKVRLAWRGLLESFQGYPTSSPVVLRHIIFPRFKLGADFSVTSLTRSQGESELQLHVLSGRDNNRPEWLGWVSRPSARRIMLGSLNTILRVEWSNHHQIDEWLDSSFS